MAAAPNSHFDLKTSDATKFMTPIIPLARTFAAAAHREADSF
jgi:hypothetical protein